MTHPDAITIPLPRRRHLLLAYVLVLPLLLLANGLLVAAWIDFGPKLLEQKANEWLDTVAILAVLVTFTSLSGMLLIFLISDFVQDLFPRALSIDFRRCEITVSNVPGLSRTFEFDEIKSLEIIKCPNRNGWWLYLCFGFCNRRWFLRLAEMRSWGRLDGEVEEQIQAKFMPLATEISELLRLPVNNQPPCGPFRTFLIRGF